MRRRAYLLYLVSPLLWDLVVYSFSRDLLGTLHAPLFVALVAATLLFNLVAVALTTLGMIQEASR